MKKHFNKLFTIITLLLVYSSCSEEINQGNIPPVITFYSSDEYPSQYTSLAISDSAKYLIKVSAGDNRLKKVEIIDNNGDYLYDFLKKTKWSGEWNQAGFIDSSRYFYFSDSATLQLPQNANSGDTVDIYFKVTDINELFFVVKRSIKIN